MTRKLRSDQVERDLQASQLRTGGASYDDIAQALGYASRSGAYKAVQRCLRIAVVEGVEEHRQIALGRLEQLFMKFYQQALQGNFKAADTCLKIMDHEAKLLGIYAPTKVESNNPAVLQSLAHKAAVLYGLDPDEVLAEAERILEETAD